MNYLLDKNFLAQLDRYHHKEIFARIISLDLNELPLEAIEGKVTQGSLNIDGSSSLRRTCNLTLIAKDLNITKYYWGLNTKFKLEIGLQNNINPNYPDIIWFPQGLYLITSFNTSQSTSDFIVTINGKDKMCLLNGEVSGNLHSPVDFGVMDIEDEETGIIQHKKILLKDIITDSVHQYGGEPYHNIIIEDLEDIALELLEYRGDTNAYVFRRVDNSDSYEQITIDDSTEVYVDDNITPVTLASLGDSFNFDDLNALMSNTSSTVRLELDGPEYTIAKITYGQTVGYRHTDLTYPGDLIMQAGDTLTMMLDKLTAMLTDFEYFYDLDGKFIFRQKRINVDSAWENIFNAGNTSSAALTGVLLPSEYTFTNSSLVTSFTNTPDFNELKNDYTVWGTRKSVAGEDLPIHIRYTIDTKPDYYKTFDGKIYTTEEIENTCCVDWREILYQMAIDYRMHNHEADYEVKLAKNNPQYPYGKTGYEQYYIDLEGFWRQLYTDKHYDKVNITEEEFQNKDYYIEYAGIYSKAEEFKENTVYYELREEFGWKENVFTQPELLNFWIDFLDFDGILNQFNIRAIGDRPKVINDSNVKAIYYKETPNLIFYNNGKYKKDQEGAYGYINIANNENLFSISTQGKSCTDKIDELLYQYGYCAESININCVPIYYLEPNTRISVFDRNSNINGQYIIQRMTIPLNYNGTMQITATKAPPQLY